MKLNNNKILMRNKEGKPNPEKMISIFRKIYYLILILIVLYVVVYFVMKAFIIKGQGFVTFDIVDIQSPYNGIVKEVNITKHIQKGQFLFNIQERFKNPIIIPKDNVKQSFISNLLIKIHTLKAQYKAKQDELKLLTKEYNKLSIYNGLNLTNNNLLQNIKNKITQTKISLSILKIQIQDYEKAYKNLPKSKPTPQKTISPFTYINHFIYSPVSGEFIEGIENNNTPVKVMDLLCKIQTYNNLRIVGYFPQKYINDLQIGDKIIILLGKKKLQGILKSIKRDKSDVKFTTQQRLKVIIIPIDETFEFWKKHNLLRVKLRKYKW